MAITGDRSLFTGPLRETKPRTVANVSPRQSGAVVLTQAGPALGLFNKMYYLPGFDMTLLPYGQLLNILGGNDLVTEGGRSFAWTGTHWRFELNADGLLEMVTPDSTATAVTSANTVSVLNNQAVPQLSNESGAIKLWRLHRVFAHM